MTETRFGSFLLHAEKFGMIPLQYIDSFEIAKLLVEQPRDSERKRPPMCHAQFDTRNELALFWRSHLKSLASLVIAIPCRVTAPRATNKERKKVVNHKIVVKLNP